MTEDANWLVGETYTDGFTKGFDVATARAESRLRLGLPIERGATLDAEDESNDA